MKPSDEFLACHYQLASAYQALIAMDARDERLKRSAIRRQEKAAFYARFARRLMGLEAAE